MLIRRSALETNFSKDDSNLSLIHRMSLYGLHFSRIWVNFKLNPLEINYINTGILSIINYHLYYIYNKNLYMNMHILILIVNIIHAYVWYILLLMLFCREYVYLARMFSTKYLSYIYIYHFHHVTSTRETPSKQKEAVLCFCGSREGI